MRPRTPADRGFCRQQGCENSKSIHKWGRESKREVSGVYPFFLYPGFNTAFRSRIWHSVRIGGNANETVPTVRPFAKASRTCARRRGEGLSAFQRERPSPPKGAKRQKPHPKTHFSLYPCGCDAFSHSKMGKLQDWVGAPGSTHLKKPYRKRRR